MISRVLFSGGDILTMSTREEAMPHRGWVGVEQGKIALVTYDESIAMAWAEGEGGGGEGEGGVEREASDSVTTQIIDCREMVIMPGLINTHSHISMTLLRNYADDMELHEWLNDHIWPFESHLTAEDIYHGARLAIVEMLLGGTTTVVDMYFKEYIIAQAMEELGMRALLTECALDGVTGDFEQNIERLITVAQQSDLVMAGVAPHAPYTCSPDTLRGVVECATKHNLHITTHLSETKIERAIIEEKHQLSPLAYLEKHGVITPRTILAHAVYLTEEEMDRIAKAGASVAHNAQSNMKLASGVAPITEMVARGINCTIATDGTSSNNDLDMWEEMRTAALLQRVVQGSPTVMRPYDMLWMATRGGAEAIGRGDLGEIAEGKCADIIVVDTTAPHMRPRHNILSSLLYSAKSGDVRDVMVGGVMRVVEREVVDVDGQCVDIEAIIDMTQSIVDRIMDELKSKGDF